MLALLIQIVASCGNLNEEPSREVFDNSLKTLTITAGLSGGLAVMPSILPSRLDCSSLTYYFAIQNLIDNSNSLQVFEAESDGVSLNFPIELSEGYYSIGVYVLQSAAAASLTGTYMTDFNSGDLADNCVLSGAATVDLRQDETISVALSTERSSQNGIVSLNFYTNGWTLDTSKFRATCGIKNKAGALVGLSYEVNLNSVTSVEPAASAVPLYYASLPAGTYTFYVNYTKLSDSSVVYTWTDSIMVLPNQTISKNIGLLDIIDYAPAAPSALKASYLDFDSDSVWCYVNFAWTDNSNNEAGFRMELKAVEQSQDDGDITSDMAASWSAVAAASSAVTGAFTRGATSSSQAFDNTGYCVDGSLNKNNSSATFKLSRGYRYLARICAVGYANAGNSDYCYVDFSLGGTGKSGYSDFDAAARYIKVGD